jgi:glycosyltransferase involved in cell wall biosynthesis
MPGISAVIIAMNAAEHIDRCLRSLDDIADEIVVVDSFSTDATQEICKKYNVKFFQHPFTGFMDQKNYALSLASNNYILSLDADEALSKELLGSLLAVKNNLRYDGYYFNRLNHYCGKQIRHSGWYPDRQMRLFNREKGRWGPYNVHETFRMNPGSSKGKLKGDLLHWPYSSEKDFSQKTKYYSEIAATEYLRAGKKTWLLDPLIHMVWRFLLTYIFRSGFLDGRNGFAICIKGAWSSWYKYTKLRKLRKEGRINKSGL